MADCLFIGNGDSHGNYWEAKQCIGSAHPTRCDACARCGGVMVVAHYVDLQGHAGEVIFKGFRCTNCGEFIDQMVLANRLKPAPQPLEGTKNRKFARQVTPKRSGKGK